MTSFSRRSVIASGLAATAATAVPALTPPALGKSPVGAPKPWGATPSPRQLAWHKRQQYAFIHF